MTQSLHIDCETGQSELAPAGPRPITPEPDSVTPQQMRQALIGLGMTEEQADGFMQLAATLTA